MPNKLDSFTFNSNKCIRLYVVCVTENNNISTLSINKIVDVTCPKKLVPLFRQEEVRSQDTVFCIGSTVGRSGLYLQSLSYYTQALLSFFHHYFASFVFEFIFFLSFFEKKNPDIVILISYMFVVGNNLRG